MIETYIKQINDLLKKIQEEYNENTTDLVNYTTSTEYNVGGMLCRYGELYKLVLKSTCYDDIIPKLENLFYEEGFEIYDELIEEIQHSFIEGLRTGLRFVNIQNEVCSKLEHDYILDTILKSL